MWLFDAEMYTNMSTLNEATPVIDRGMSLHKMIRTITMALGGEAWLNFMGNEFGHPEWLDFPREGNGWSHQHCRRQWSLVDTEHMRYCQLNAWDKAMMELDDKYSFTTSPVQWVTHIDQENQVRPAQHPGTRQQQTQPSVLRRVRVVATQRNNTNMPCICQWPDEWSGTALLSTKWPSGTMHIGNKLAQSGPSV
eukprot:GHRR01014777.1.p1 GENE.GHRR01014777.1~~GHRR01014777.1.p1  ORF type:complete len:194 (+),score=35.50 GHRR01014777.1:929-1510(+)